MKPENLLYAKTHEWVSLETDAAGRRIATVGLSKHAFDLLTDLVFIDLPEIGDTAEAGETFGEIESVKAVSAMVSPVYGEIIAVNDAVRDRLETLGQDPYDSAWLIKIKLSDNEGLDQDNEGLDQLMDFAAYQTFCKSEPH